MNMTDFYREMYETQTTKSAKMAALIGMYEGTIKGLIEGWMSPEQAKEQIVKGQTQWDDIQKISSYTRHKDNNEDSGPEFDGAGFSENDRLQDETGYEDLGFGI